MKSLHRFLVALPCLLLISAAPPAASAQEAAPSPQQAVSEVESLRRQVEEQKARIQQLQADMRQQSQSLEKQQKLLEELVLKTERLGSAGPGVRVINASASAPAAGDAEPAAVTQTAPAAAQTTPPQPEGVRPGYGKIKFGGLVQAWFAAGNQGFSDTFRIRRAELEFSGEINPKVRWKVMIDPSRGLSLNRTFTTIAGTPVVRDVSVNQGSRILQDAFVTLGYVKHMDINVGQQKLPLSLEGTQSSSRLDTVERALFLSDGGRGGSLGDVRDLGVTFTGSLFSTSLDYYVGVFNGVGLTQNDVDRNDQKSVVGRLVYRPAFAKGLQVGGSGAWENGGFADRPRRDRLGAEGRFVRGPVTLKAEVMSGKDADLHRLGYYGHFGYRFVPKLEGVFRVDTFDPDRRRETNAADVRERDYVAGLNYFIEENHVKLQFNYLRKTFKNDIVRPRNLVLVNLQTAW